MTKLTPTELAQAYKDYNFASRVIGRRIDELVRERLPRDEFKPLMRVYEHVCSRRESYWKELVKLPVPAFSEALDNSKYNWSVVYPEINR